MRRVEVVWPEELVARIDQVRGDVSRARWIARAVERALGVCEVGAVARSPVSARRAVGGLPGDLPSFGVPKRSGRPSVADTWRR